MGSSDKLLRASQVLVEECRDHFGDDIPDAILRGTEDTPEYMERVYDFLNRRNRTALCLSGGGIRSATFGLGLLQGLAREKRLTQFDYLSTVSGGGYIGSWLSAWIHRREPNGERVGIGAVQDVLGRVCEGSKEPRELRHLRDYSNFLTPKVGLLSTDTWTTLAVYLRNLLLHWLMLLPLFLLPMFPAYVGWQLLQMDVSMACAWLAFAGGAVALFWASGFLSYNLPSARAWPLIGLLDPKTEQDKIDAIQGRRQWHFLVFGLLPAMTAAAGLSLALAWFWKQPPPDPSTEVIGPIVACLRGWAGDQWQLVLLTIAGAGGRCVAWLAALGHIWKTNREIRAMKLKLGDTVAAVALEPSHELSGSIIFWELAVSLLTGAIGGLLVGVTVTVILGNPYESTTLLGHKVTELTHIAIYLCVAPLLFMLTFLLSESLFIGLTSYVTRDEDREWWGRAGAWMLIAALGWLLFHVLVIFGPVTIEWLNYKAPYVMQDYGGLPGLISLASGALAALLGGSSKSPAPGQKAETGIMARLRGLILTLAAGLFVVSLFAGLAWLLSNVLSAVSGAAGCDVAKDTNCTIAHDVLLRQSQVNWHKIAGLFFILAGVGFATWWSINVNRFSMHATYRDRLIRCFLGAARGNGGSDTGSTLRKPDWFTGFDPNDNMQFRDLAVDKPVADPEKRAPLHIVNIAVNLVSDKVLGWQQRKAASFTASALHAGSDILGYRSMNVYGGHNGMSLGTAIAISGAAASPNMGYHSSPIVTLILALFNVRLGWWLGNPRRSRRTVFGRPIYQCDGPALAVVPLIAECFGLTNKRADFIYLTDGGHFENLGLYEMVRRRCRLIVVSDAGCDADYAFADLGNAIRKIRIDLGVDIEMQAMYQVPRDDKYIPGIDRNGFYCGIGTIKYPKGEAGTLIYIKPGLYGGEPQDVLNYASENRLFPHEPTSDQWFSESQFESYRRLGEYVALKVFDVLQKETDSTKWAEAIKKTSKRL